MDCHFTVLRRNGKALGRMYACSLWMVPTKVTIAGRTGWYPTSREKRARYPEFPARSPGHDRVEPNKPHRKSGIWGTRGSVARTDSSPVVENEPADCHGHQQQTGEEEQQPSEDPPDAGLRGQNAPLGLKTVY